MVGSCIGINMGNFGGRLVMCVCVYVLFVCVNMYV